MAAVKTGFHAALYLNSGCPDPLGRYGASCLSSKCIVTVSRHKLFKIAAKERRQAPSMAA
jgi:hypothetical protein